MTKKKIIFALLALTLAVLAVLCSCTGAQTADSTDAATEDASASDNSTAADERITVVGKGEAKIHSISELNSDSAVIDSHAGMEQYSTLELNYREYTQLSGIDLAGVNNAYYPRIRQMKNGKYIMTYQAGRISWEVHCAFSDDGVKWKNSQKLLETCEYPNGYNDTMLFMTADLCVLDDGSIIVVSAFRGKSNYSTDVNSNGIVVIKSTDNGQTWSEKKVIYTGTCWEPYVMQTSSGEVQVYFTQTGHLIALHGWDPDRRSSCVGLLRSSDRGETWTQPKDYSAQIIMQQFIYRKNGYDYMCDQMPSAIELHDGRIALAAETCNAQDSYRLSVAFSSDNWAKSLGFAERGPADRVDNFIQAAGPYLAQFASGETLLSCHTSKMHVYMGNNSAKNFTNEYQPFPDHKGHWGSLYVDSGHSVIATMANTLSGEISSPKTTSLDVGRLYLNHAVFARSVDIKIDGKTDDWEANTEALFVGSDSQAQMSIRFSYDDERVYILVERLDNYLMKADQEGIFIAAPDGSYYIIKFGAEGIDSIQHNVDGRFKNVQLEGIEWAMTIVGTVGDKQKDTGKILEMSFPRELVSISESGVMPFNAMIYNKDKEAEKAVGDGFSNVTVTDRSTWQRVYLTK